MLLTVDRGNIRRSPQTSDIGPVIGAFFRTLQHAQRQSLLPGCVCVCARLLGIRVQETQWPIVCLLAFQFASGLA